MSDSLAGRYAALLGKHSRLILVLVVLATVLVGAGAVLGGDPGDGGLGQFEVDSPEFEAAAFVRANYAGEDLIRTQIVVREEGGNVLTRDSLLAGLDLQLAAREDQAIPKTLDGDGFVGFENLVGTAAVIADAGAAGEQPPHDPSLEAQRAALAARDDEEVRQLVATILDPEATGGLPAEVDPLRFLPRDVDREEPSAESRLTIMRQVDDSGEDEEPTAAYDAQVLVAEMVDDRFTDGFAFGQGINDAASSNATGDSFAIITPFALVLILFVLGITYRDVVDILLAIGGIILVMVWLLGIMRWLAIPMNVILIAVPFLLIGLSIDYAVHVVMRYREARLGLLDEAEDVTETAPAEEAAELAHDETAGDSPRLAGVGGGPAVRAGMVLGLGSVVLALAAATISTGVGFFSNVLSPLPAIRDFAVLSAGGILATFVAFGIFLPALKIEVDTIIEERFGRSRAKPAFGASAGRANRLMSGFASLTWRSPVVILAVAVLLATAGGYGATTIDTEFNQADFLPEDPPGWTSYLPGPFEPGTYTIADDFAYLNDNFAAGDGQGGQASILIRGDVTDDAFLATLDREIEQLEDDGVIQFRADGSPEIEGPTTAIRAAAADNESFAATVEAADRTGNGLPDENLGEIFAKLFEADEQLASQYFSREDGEITSVRLLIGVSGTESSQAIAASVGDLATAIETAGLDVTAVPTSEVVTDAVLQDALLETLIQAFSVTLVVIFLFLTLLFYVRYRSASMGAVVILPVVTALTWLLGVMALLDIPFNSETAVITSLAIGLGVDYSIHAGERYLNERARRDTLQSALEAMVTGTGGALLASAATTAAGFGVLALALSPPLQRFGIVTGAAIILAFVAVVTMLPSLLIVRDRLLNRFEW